MMAKHVVHSIALLAAGLWAGEAVCDSERALLVVMDGLRPDYVTPEVMPVLHALGESGVVFERHHAVFPTVTRVNAASIATGAYPAVHGLLENIVYFPGVEERPMNTGDRENLLRIDAAEAGALLTADSLGEALERAGKKLLVISSGSSGSAHLLNHKAAGCGVLHVDFAAPADFPAEAIAAAGPAPGEGLPNTARNLWVAEAYLRAGLDVLKPDLTVLWLSDPDHTAHAKGMGTPETVAALRGVDAALGRILDGLAARGLRDAVSILVTSDHGFATYTGSLAGQASVGAFLARHGLEQRALVRAGSAWYAGEGLAPLLPELVRELQGMAWVGAVFSTAEIPGTLPFSVARWNHARAGALLVMPDWTDGVNEHGFAGTTMLPGVAGHGNSSPWEIHNTLIASGPAFKRGVRSGVPSGNVDLAPTLCAILGIAGPRDAEGRVLREALEGGPAPESIELRMETHRSASVLGDGAGYVLEVVESHAAGARYLDYTKVRRSAPGKE